MPPDRRRWKILSLMACAILLVMTTWFSATAVVQQLTEHLGLSNSGRVWLTVSVQIGFVAGALCSAMSGWADRFSGRTLIVAGAVLVALINLSILWLGHAAPVIVARFFTGFFLAIVYPPAMKLIATWFTTRRGVAMGIVIAATTLGTATPHLINALGGLAWEIVVVCTSIFALIGGLIVALFIREGLFLPLLSFQFKGGDSRFQKPLGVVGNRRLFRTHVGALRHVGVVRGFLSICARAVQRSQQRDHRLGRDLYCDRGGWHRLCVRRLNQ